MAGETTWAPEAGPARVPVPGLRRNRDFLKFWAGQSVSLLGDEVSALALPLVAVTTLHASAGEMGLLAATGRAPIVLLSLAAGVWVDRVRRRPLLVGADLGRALLLGCVPLAVSVDLLTMPVLYGVSGAVAVLGLLYTVAAGSYLPALVPRTALVEGNAKLGQSRSLAGVVGPGVAGVAIQVLTAPGALLLDACSFVVSAFCVLRIQQREPGAPGAPGEPGEPGVAPPPLPHATQLRSNVWRDMNEGLRAVWGDGLLRAPAGAVATYNLFFNVINAVYVLHLTRERGIGPAALSVLFALYALGGLGGSLLAARVGSRFGMGPVMVAGIAAAGTTNLAVALALGVTEAPGMLVALLAAGSLARGFSGPFYGVNQRSLQQAITPDRLRGRVSGTLQFVVGCTGLVGALAGGALGETIGLLPAITAGAVGTLLAVPWLLLSAVRRLHEPPALQEGTP